MPAFICKLGSPEGDIVSREIEAADEIQLRDSLRTQGFHVFSLRRRGLSLALRFTPTFGKQITNQELLSLNQELIVLLKAGMPIVPALDAILEHRRKANDNLALTLEQIREDVKSGTSLSAALGKNGKFFPALYLASVKAGERTGDIPNTIKRYNVFLKSADELRKKVISSTFYPAIIVVVAVLLVMLLLVYVVPTFSQIYSESGSQLPLLTRALINVANFLKSTIVFWLPGLICAFFCLRLWANAPKGRFFIDHWKLHLPVLGDLFFWYSVSGFSRTMANLMGSGIPIVESLKMSLGTLNNSQLEKKMNVAIRQVEEGGRLSFALEQQQLMPTLALRMLGIGESTGSLEEMLVEIAEHLEGLIAERMHILITALEPAVMAITGVIIGIIIIAMYLPVFKLAGTVGG